MPSFRVHPKMRKWRRDLHEFDPQTEEEQRELYLYLKKLDASVEMCVVKRGDSEEDEDMSMWDLL